MLRRTAEEEKWVNGLSGKTKKGFGSFTERWRDSEGEEGAVCNGGVYKRAWYPADFRSLVANYSGQGHFP